MEIVRVQNFNNRLAFQANVEKRESTNKLGYKANTPEFEQAVGKRTTPMMGERSLWFTKGAEGIVLPIRQELEKISKGYNVSISEVPEELNASNTRAFVIKIGSEPKKSNPIKNFFNRVLGAKNQFVSKTVIMGVNEGVNDIGKTNVLKDTINALKNGIVEHDSKLEYTIFRKLMRKG